MIFLLRMLDLGQQLLYIHLFSKMENFFLYLNVDLCVSITSVGEHNELKLAHEGSKISKNLCSKSINSILRIRLFHLKIVLLHITQLVE